MKPKEIIIGTIKVRKGYTYRVDSKGNILERKKLTQTQAIIKRG